MLSESILSSMKLVVPVLMALVIGLPLSTPGHADSTGPKFKVVFSGRQRDSRGVPSGMQQLYTADGDGTHLSQLSPLGPNVYYDWPMWALNGTRIVFTARTTVEDLGQEGVYMSRPDGSDVVNLLASDWPSGQPKLSADGQTLLFTSSWPQFRGTALYRLSLRTGLVESLTAQAKAVHDSDGRWSPDGQTIVFAGLGDELNGVRPAQVMASNAFGSDRVRVTHDLWHNVDPMLSPDGHYVAYSSYRGDGHPAGLIPGQIVAPDADLTKLRVHLNNWQLIVLEMATGAERSLTQGKNCPEVGWWEACQPAEGPAWVPVWLPDGKQIAYLSARSGLDAGIYAVGADGSGAHVVFESRDLVLNWHDWALADSPAEAPAPVIPPKLPQAVLWGGLVHELDSATGADVPTQELFVTTPDLWFGRRIQPTNSSGRTLPVQSARWTPDRQRILFTSPVAVANQPTAADDDPQMPASTASGPLMLDQIFVMNADGSQVRQLTTPTTEDPLEPLDEDEVRSNVDPDMSPDGHSVIFSSRAPGGQSSLLRLDLVSGEVVNLTSVTSGIAGGFDLAGRFSPDGKTIALGSVAESVQLALMSSDGRNFHIVTADLHDNTDPAWSPDGRWLVYISHRQDQEVDLVKVNLETGAQFVLARAPGQISRPIWTPDGKNILCIGMPALDHIDDFVQSDIYLVSAEGGVLHPLAVTLTTAEAFVDWR